MKTIETPRLRLRQWTEQDAEAITRPDIAQRVMAKIGDIPHTTQRYRFVAMNMIAEHLCELE